MPKKNKKKLGTDSVSEFGDIGQFEVGSTTVKQQTPRKVTAHARKPNRRAEKRYAREFLNSLIEADAAQASSAQQRSPRTIERTQTSTRAGQDSTDRPSSRPSRHVLDLRKKYLIEKYELHTIQRPRAPFLEQLEDSISHWNRQRKIKWHYPETAKRSKPHRDISTEAAPSPAYVGSRIVSFTSILVLILAPVPLVLGVQKISSHVSNISIHGNQALASLQQGVSALQQQDLIAASTSLRTAQGSFQKIADAVASYDSDLINILAPIPQIQALYDTLSGLAAVGAETSAIGALLADNGSDDPASLPIGAIIDELYARTSRLRSAYATALAALQRVPSYVLPADLHENVDTLRQNMIGLNDGIKRTADLLAIADDLFGQRSQGRYLVLFQNNRELRPTGGFIGSYALLDLQAGAIRSIEFPGGGTYDLAGGFQYHLIPPKPLSIVNREWNLWDANWWPDFFASAQKIAWFYEQSSGQSVDGVIAINSDVMLQLLAHTGPIRMPQYNVEITEKNFYEVVQREVEQQFDKTQNQPKKILKDLYPMIFERIAANKNYAELLTVIATALETKDIQLAFLNHQGTQDLVIRNGWGGILPKPDKDFLSVVTTNIAGGKSDSSIFQTIDHVARIRSDGRIEVTVRVLKENHAVPEDQFAYVNNVDYIRFYVPPGSSFISARGFTPVPEELYRTPETFQTNDTGYVKNSDFFDTDPTTKTDIGTELGYTVFGNWMQVEPNQSTWAEITYELPFRITLTNSNGVSWFAPWQQNHHEIDRYGLTVVNQSGKRNVIFNSSVEVPDKYQIVWSNSVDSSQLGATSQRASLSTRLDHTTSFNLLLSERDPSS
ncbi:MAG: hypothetical protein A2677_02650 [Candidatus Komeilibacteria bacterium RIFCSPHIGHO2_01_FULL_52_14]|uniref:DUF4012 domain-containing protein n=1 Tax=Candidatus Komeilibacteria bacterium RIFCSPHIGHO2_01_FULL_52_14 TaxID=1798549 RepID=A0A1G2BLV0_9BACT|nr:MAG: hypothetical protein A2677_02650 [Candidatus Komeilibacteria bacterium RIFCSPHIGHO2_01_FULL_52_14]